MGDSAASEGEGKSADAEHDAALYPHPRFSTFLKPARGAEGPLLLTACGGEVEGVQRRGVSTLPYVITSKCDIYADLDLISKSKGCVLNLGGELVLVCHCITMS